MQIKNKWVIHETHDDGYFVGHSEGVPVFEPLTSRTRTYQTKGYAMKAIGQIKRIECQDYVPEYIENREVPDIPKDKPSNSKETCCLCDELHKLCDKYNISFGDESQGFGAELADLARKYRKIIPDVPADKPSDPKMTVAGDESEWETVFVCAVPPREQGGKVTFSKIALCRRQVGDREIFGVRAFDGKLYSAGFGGGETALRCFLEEYYNYLLPRVTRESR